MNKNHIRSILAGAILLILFLVVVFVIPFPKTAVFWVTLVFDLAAFGLAYVSVYIAFVRQPGAKSKFYGFPIARIGALYLALQILVGLVFMALGKVAPMWLVVLVYAVALGAAALGLIGADVVVEQIHRQDAQLKADVSLMRSLQSKLNQMASQCGDPDAAAAVTRFAEELRYSDPVSSEALGEIERDLSAAVDDLQAAIVDGDDETVKQMCRRASAVLTERNRLCKLNKG